jgi:hypothetical protein
MAPFWKHGSNAALGCFILAVALMDVFAWRVHPYIAHIPYRPRTLWGR